uniref:Uncharacterized protein n=1 Tax=Rhizophora mucronata TaxID=61149 RepID=A0A2P2QDJ8_RHIMU
MLFSPLRAFFFHFSMALSLPYVFFFFVTYPFSHVILLSFYSFSLSSCVKSYSIVALLKYYNLSASITLCSWWTFSLCGDKFSGLNIYHE